MLLVCARCGLQLRSQSDDSRVKSGDPVVACSIECAVLLLDSYDRVRVILGV